MSEISGIQMGLDATYDPNANKRVPNQNLGKDDFLKLMITQMRFQDPLNPQDNTEQIAQQAQFSTLEQMQNLNKSMETLIDIYQSGNRSAAVSIIGAEVDGFVSATDANGLPEVKEIKGIVKGIDFSSGDTIAIVATETGDQRVPYKQITKIMDPMA